MTSKTIIKRDNTTELFDINKIKKVLNIAFNNTKTDCNNIDEILNYINDELVKRNEDCYKIEDIQDLVENTLMIYKYYETAKHYIHYREGEEAKEHTDTISSIRTYIIMLNDDFEGGDDDDGMDRRKRFRRSDM